MRVIRGATPDRRAPDLPVWQRTEDGAALVVEMAHDLRSPLASILMLSETLGAGMTGPVTDAQREQLRLIYTAALGLCNVANDVLDLAHDDQRLLAGEAESFSLFEVLDGVRSIVLPMRGGRHVAVECHVPREDQRWGHPRRLARVLLNLAANAVRVTEHGYVRMEARELPDDPDRLVISVSDTGPGMDGAAQRALFHQEQPTAAVATQTDPFFSGAGIGLLICRRLVASMGATLCVESRLGLGTHFSFEIAAARARPTGAASRQVNGPRDDPSYERNVATTRQSLSVSRPNS